MTEREKKEVEIVIRDMLDIALMAMPDSYFSSDKRVQRAKKLLDKLLGRRE
jgi:hypothetical protein